MCVAAFRSARGTWNFHPSELWLRLWQCPRGSRVVQRPDMEAGAAEFETSAHQLQCCTCSLQPMHAGMLQDGNTRHVSYSTCASYVCNIASLPCYTALQPLQACGEAWPFSLPDFDAAIPAGRCQHAPCTSPCGCPCVAVHTAHGSDGVCMHQVVAAQLAAQLGRCFHASLLHVSCAYQHL